MRQHRTRPAVLRSVRTACWIGVGIDAVATIGLALPASSRVRGMIYPAVTAGGEYAAGSRSAAPLMAGWTVLLAWVARDPVSRRQPLLLTSVPVIAGLITAEVADVRKGRASAALQAPTIVLQLALLVLFIRAYQQARDLAADAAQDLPSGSTSGADSHARAAAD
jgi:hypothetical protein